MGRNFTHWYSTDCDLCGQLVHLHVYGNNVYGVRVNFVLHGNPYEFVLPKWSGRKLAPFCVKFHEFYLSQSTRIAKNDDDYKTRFGGMDASGNLFGLDSREIILNILQQAIMDVFAGINLIYNKHRQGLLDYAVWHRETRPNSNSYSEQMIRIACDCIVHSALFAPGEKWDAIEFI